MNARFQNTTVEEENGHLIPDIVSTLLLLLAILVNILGVYLLYLQDNKKWTHQKIILTSLSISLTTVSISELTYLIGEWVGLKAEKSEFLKYCDVVIAGLFFTYYLILFTLTAMRLLSCVCVFNYHEIIHHKTLVCILASFWIVGLIVATPFFFVTTETFVEIWYKWIYISLDGLILVSVIFTYSFIVRTSYKSKKTTNSTFSTYSNKQYVKVTLLIVISFVVFVVTPDIYFAYRFVYRKDGTMIEERVIMACWQLNYIIDPLIYIFFQQDVRRTLRRVTFKLLCKTYLAKARK